MEKIIGKCLAETENPSDYLVAFVVSMVTIILNPKNCQVRIDSEIVPLVKKNLVSIENFPKKSTKIALIYKFIF